MPPPRGIRTHDPSRRSAADPRLRPRGHWDRRVLEINDQKEGKGRSLYNYSFYSPPPSHEIIISLENRYCLKLISRFK
jgi:hypothetical protein